LAALLGGPGAGGGAGGGARGRAPPTTLARASTTQTE
jgi:hypothetical protein